MKLYRVIFMRETHKKSFGPFYEVTRQTDVSRFAVMAESAMEAEEKLVQAGEIRRDKNCTIRTEEVPRGFVFASGSTFKDK